MERGTRVIKIHVKYDSSNTDNDVALIELDEPVDINSLPNVRTVCIPLKDPPTKYVGRKATVTGWGMTSYSGATSNVLREVRQTSSCVMEYSYNFAYV